MPLAVLDASVVISLLSTTDALHLPCAAWFAGARSATGFALPASAYAEVAVGALWLGDAGLAKLDGFLAAASIDVRELSRQAARESARLRASDRALRLPDALVLGCGVAVSADSIVTTDQRWSRYDARVRVIR